MTRTYALQRLLQHGAMPRADLEKVTGWTERELDKALAWLLSTGKVERAIAGGFGRYVYRLPADHYLPALV